MATTVGLISHGVTEWNNIGKAQGVSDIPLNEEGIKQSIALAHRLSREVSAALVMMVQQNMIPSWIAIVIIGREVMVMILAS
ncbi:histidine phosphatase family protein [Paenibacillus planticolens]|uniref:Uncharacterized protein n=1 Tax=Paenibacillus planticolens TaxID=2654976 RepID=A0ABX1ZSC7_9BACL|nr:hypothetical protein [Paenibacillus planticolens]